MRFWARCPSSASARNLTLSCYMSNPCHNPHMEDVPMRKLALIPAVAAVGVVLTLAGCGTKTRTVTLPAPPPATVYVTPTPTPPAYTPPPAAPAPAPTAPAVDPKGVNGWTPDLVVPHDPGFASNNQITNACTKALMALD